MQVTDMVIQLTPDEIAGKTDCGVLLAAIASIAAQETVTPEDVRLAVHSVTFDVVQASYNSWTRTRDLLGVQVKAERHCSTVLLRRVMLKAGTLDIAKLRAAYQECKVKAEEVAVRDAEIDETAAKRQAETVEAARRAALYPEMLAALEDLAPLLDSCCGLVDEPDQERIDQACAVIARCTGGAK